MSLKEHQADCFPLVCFMINVYKTDQLQWFNRVWLIFHFQIVVEFSPPTRKGERFYKLRQHKVIIIDYYNNCEMQILPERCFSSLKKVAQQCQASSSPYTGSIMGVVIDMTRPLNRERDKDYIIELKIVDETINEAEMYGILAKYCSVYVFGKTYAQLEICNKIGQLVYLDKFTFSLWNQIKLQTKYLSTIERLYCLDFEGDQLKLFNQICTSHSEDIFTEQVVFRAKNLRKWFNNRYFFKSYKPILGINLINNFCVMAEPFNMILRVSNFKTEEVHLMDQSLENHIVLEDTHENRFIINTKLLPAVFPSSKHLFIRNIRNIGNYYEIVLSETGYALGLPDHLEKEYEEAMNYCAISRFKQRFLLKNHKTCNLSKINFVPPKNTPISELLSNIDLYQTKYSTKQDVLVEDLYLIQGVVINFQGKLHMFHSQLQMITDNDFIDSLTQQQKTQMIQKGVLEYLYEGVLGVLDRSSESLGKLLYIHLFTNEKRARFFDASIIEPLNKTIGIKKDPELEKQIKSQIQEKLRNLIQKSDFTNTVSMLLQPIKSDVLIYRLTNTIFL